MEILDFPGNYTFLEKLNLYQHYLKKNSLLEKTRGKYWLFGKAILYWSFSETNEYIGTPLSIHFICSKEINNQLIAVARTMSVNNDYLAWLEENSSQEGTIENTLANLQMLGFIKDIYSSGELRSDDKYNSTKHSPYKFVITSKGLLMGELLYELYSSNFLEKLVLHVQYRWSLRLFYVLLVILFLTALLVFIDNLRITGILNYLQQTISSFVLNHKR